MYGTRGGTKGMRRGREKHEFKPGLKHETSVTREE